MRIISILGIFVGLFIAFVANAQAQSMSNNKFGIHIIDEHDLEDASALVNSNGGEWGYVTIVIREDERDKTRWQNIFDQMRRLKLIPIVRVATTMNGPNWDAPEPSDALEWAEFLHSFNWPVKTRYIALFNEPNHTKEWGGKIDPAEYVWVAKEFEKELRKLSDDFFVLPAALDLAAGNTRTTMEASRYFELMHEEDLFIFTRFDGLNSHSYPNPGFIGDATDTGKESIQGYKWELAFLENFGLRPDVPVFITETGWNLEDEEKLVGNFSYAFDNVWNDNQVLAVTPFLLNYIGEPFDGFSWRDTTTREFKKHYSAIQGIRKVKAEPVQDHSYEFVSSNIAKRIVASSEYLFEIVLKNTGQSIWSSKDGFSLHYSVDDPKQIVKVGNVPFTEPGQNARILVKIHSENDGRYTLQFELNKNESKIGDTFSTQYEVVKPPQLEVNALGWFGFSDTSNEYSLTISKGSDFIVNLKNVFFEKGKFILPNIYNVIPGERYNVAIKRSYHAGRSKSIVLEVDSNKIDFGRLIPIDLNNDGEVSIKDIATHVLNPHKIDMAILPF